MKTEILDDCKQFADRHRGKNKQSGAHWSTIIRFAPLYDEAVRLQKRIAELEQKLRWIPVSERLPRAGEKVLIQTHLGNAYYHTFDESHAEQFKRNFKCWISNPLESEEE